MIVSNAIPSIDSKRPTAWSNGGAEDDGTSRMKLLLSLIETADAVGTEFLAANVHAAASSNDDKASNGSDTRRNIVTPTPASQGQAQPQPQAQAHQVAFHPKMIPLSRPPTLVSTAMFLSQSKRQHQPKALKMPPPLATPGGSHPNMALRSLNYNHFVPPHDSPGPVVTGTMAKHALATPMASLLKCLSEAGVPEESTKEESPSQLHIVCCWKNDPSWNVAGIIGSIVARDPMAIRRKCKIVQTGTTGKSAAVVVLKNSFLRSAGTPRFEPYGFPLNLALLHQSQDRPDLRILRLLAELGPDVLRLDDGRNGGGSLTIALRHHPKNLDIVRLLLESNPNCIHVSDKRGNRPLHVACFRGAPLEVIQELYHHDPSAMDKTNMAGETPWEIVQRNSRLSSSPVAEFLYACTKRREGRHRKSNPPTYIYMKN